jgi:hypothetical protein
MFILPAPVGALAEGSEGCAVCAAGVGLFALGDFFYSLFTGGGSHPVPQHLSPEVQQPGNMASPGSIAIPGLVFTAEGTAKAENSQPKQSFSKCMAANSSLFSLAGLAQGAVNGVLGTTWNFRDTLPAQLLLGNSVSGILFGSVGDATVSARARLHLTYCERAWGRSQRTAGIRPPSHRSISRAKADFRRRLARHRAA